VSGHGRHLLVVEDEPSLRLTLVDRLEAEAYRVTVAVDGDAALEAASAGGFDLILLDVALPKRDGFDVCRELRAQGNAVPILMLTARSQVVTRPSAPPQREEQLSPETRQYKCREKLGFVPNVLAAYAFDEEKLKPSRPCTTT
jgi:CheY-like chemotaxis protein